MWDDSYMEMNWFDRYLLNFDPVVFLLAFIAAFLVVGSILRK